MVTVLKFLGFPGPPLIPTCLQIWHDQRGRETAGLGGEEKKNLIKQIL